jgi:pimeloyl-ACP methyl ester carboxylesterase
MKKLLSLFCKTIFWAILLVVLFVGVFFTVASIRERFNTHEMAPNWDFITMNDGGEVFLTDTGENKNITVVLVHGTGSWWGIWEETVNELKTKNYRVIAIDLPPFGYSTKYVWPENYTREKQADRIKQVIAKLNLTNVYLVAHSIWARSAVELVMEWSDAVKSLILIDPALGLDAIGQFAQNNPNPLVKQIFWIPTLRHLIITSVLTNSFFTKKIFSGFVHNPDSISEKNLGIIQKPYNLHWYSQWSADWIFSMFFTPDMSISTNFSDYKTIATPVCMIWGGLDTVTPLSQAHTLLWLIPGSTLHIVKGVGHIPYIENVESFHKELEDCLKR